MGYDARAHSEILGTAVTGAGLENHRAPFHLKRRGTDPSDISEAELERRAFLAFRCTDADLAFPGSAKRAAYQFLLQTVGNVVVHLRRVDDADGLLGRKSL